MITRQKLLEIKKQVKDPASDYTTRQAQLVHTLVDHGLECLDKIDGGAEQRDWAAERARMDNQIKLALADLTVATQALANTAQDSLHPDYGTKALYVLHCVDQMLSAKLAWAREWSYYVPRIEEEFS